MMVLYIHDRENGMEMMIQEVYSTYRAGGKFCYDRCQGMMIQYILIMECLWLWYVPQMVMVMLMDVVCSTIGYGNVYGCGMFHNWLWKWLWLWYVPQLLWNGYNCYGMDMVVVCSTVAMIWLWYVPPGLVNQRSGCYDTLSGDPAIGGAVWQCPNKLM